MAPPTVPPVTPRSMRLIIQNCRPRPLRRKSTTKHYKALEEGTFAGYKPLEPDKRKELLEQAKKMDQNSSVQLEASAPTVAPGGTLSVTVTTKGGIGPVVGIMLLDEPLRYQARPIQGTGWFIANAPEVIGADGKPQSKWLDRRFNKQQTNLNFIWCTTLPLILPRTCMPPRVYPMC